ncbi:polysaccharide deacetylase family protein [Ancylobacter terrae]|uniref:polysaccharide deacetylase family protein n=1 Tax=Ancylobacter sp. sgz301288 TaxID=3342077 RepID=UPI00385B62EC
MNTLHATNCSRNRLPVRGIAVARVPDRLRYAGLRLGLEIMSLPGIARRAAPVTGGMGAILTLHHVRPPRPGAFQPNAILEIAPSFLDALLTRLARAGIEFVTLAEAVRRIGEGRSARRFVCFTADDGYRDNRDFAQPLFARHGVPWTLFVATAFADGTGELWWLALEAVIAAQEAIEVDLGAGVERLDCRTAAGKRAAYGTIYWHLRSLDEPALRAFVRALAGRYGVDPAGFCPALCMDWSELAAVAADPLVTIGAHTVTHPRLATLPREQAVAEMRDSRAIIEARLGIRPSAFAYPVGDPTSAGIREFALAEELGFDAAVTTRPGVLTPACAVALQALPRISLNGLFQKPRYVEALISGLPFARIRGSRAGNRPSPSSG